MQVRNPTALVMKWLPDMDLNHDKQIQSLLCYRYTMRQYRMSLKNEVGVYRIRG